MPGVKGPIACFLVLAATFTLAAPLAASLRRLTGRPGDRDRVRQPGGPARRRVRLTAEEELTRPASLPYALERWRLPSAAGGPGAASGAGASPETVGTNSPLRPRPSRPEGLFVLPHDADNDTRP